MEGPGIGEAPWSKNRSKLLRIDVYMLLTAAALTILVICGSARRCYYSKMLRWIIQGSYVLLALLITYTLGQMQSASFRNDFFPIWAVFLFAVHGGADSISAYSLEDNEQGRKFGYTNLFLLCWSGILISMHSSEKKFLAPLLCLMIGFYNVTNGERYDAFVMASKYGVERMAKEIASYVSREHAWPREAESINPIRMTGYKYPMMVEGKDGYSISVDKIWQCKGKLLASTEDQDSKRKDICLSYALFNILCCRFGGYHLSEYCSHEKTSRFVREGLLSGAGNDGARAFRLIEVELAFVYDLFYTKYAITFKDIGQKYRLLRLCLVMISYCLATASVLHSSPPPQYLANKIMGHNVEVMVTGIVGAVLFFVEIAQLLFYGFSQWGKLHMLCKYVEKQSKSVELITKIVCGFSIPWLKPWGRKLGQYSFLTSFNYRPSRIIHNFLTSQYFDQPGIGRRESSPTKLPNEVKRAVVARIKNDDRSPTNGITSLRNNGVENEMSWACRLNKQVQVIMLWHIATSICEESTLGKQSTAQQPSGEVPPAHSTLEDHITVATSLSKYCAYLVAFAPRLLPGHAYDSEVTLDDIVREATTFFRGCENIDSVHAKLMSQSETQNPPQGSVMKQSAQLARELINIGDETRRWKILSDFWTEMILFVAPSGDATAHAQHLATGGEFVTHLWALLFHAGIDGRDSSTVDHDNVNV